MFCRCLLLGCFLFSELSSLLKNKDSKDSKKASVKTVVSDGNWSLYKFTLFHLSFVSTLCAGIMHWGIYAIDPNALTPKDFYYPLLLNNMHHTFPWILSFLQVFIFVKREINSFSLKIDAMKANEIGMVSTFLLGVSYSLTALSKKVILGKLPYPFLNDLTYIQYSIFNMFLLAFGMMISNISTQVIFKIAKTMRKQAGIDKSK